MHPILKTMTFVLCLLLLVGCTNDENQIKEDEDSAIEQIDIEQEVEILQHPTLDRIVVAGKPFTEQQILTYMLKLLLQENLDIEIIARIDHGSTDDIHKSLIQGNVDLYIEYTGTAYLNVLNLELDSHDFEYVFQSTRDAYADRFDLIVLPAFQFDNTFAITISKQTAEQLNVSSNSDLAIYSPTLVFTSDPNFFERMDGYDALNETYGFSWARAIDIAPDLMYTALINEDTDVITGFSTDPRMIEYDLVTLEDDLHFFPPYEAIPIIRPEILQSYPQIETWLARIGEHLTNSKMTELNARVSLQDEHAEQVARDFLIELDLIPH